MYLVTIDDRFIFFWADPRPLCPHPVAEGADFIDRPPRNDYWKHGYAEPQVLVRSNRSPLTFKAFRSELDIHSGWEILDGVADVLSTK